MTLNATFPSYKCNSSEVNTLEYFDLTQVYRNMYDNTNMYVHIHTCIGRIIGVIEVYNTCNSLNCSVCVCALEYKVASTVIYLF